jgi:hypothetical protein
MKKIIQKILVVLGLSLGLSTTTPPQLAAGTQDNIDLVTALLRLPCGILEYDLRNDDSRSAYLAKAAIHTVQMLNDFTSSADTPEGLWIIYDAIKIVKNLYAFVTTKSKDHLTNKKATIEKNETLIRFILPAIEMLGAVARTKNVVAHLPLGGRVLASFGISLSRLTRLYLLETKNLAVQKTIMRLLVAHVIWFVYFIKTTYTLHTDGTCTICIEDFKNPQALSCGHVFCFDCLKKLKESYANSKQLCPNCRAPFSLFFAT